MIFISNNHPVHRISRRETFRAIHSVLQAESSLSMMISVVFVGSRYIRSVNRQFLNHDYITDVIAFPFDDGLGIDGELYVNLDRARTQAREYGVAFLEEVRRLLIHGTLHLLGYSDATVRTKARMKKKEDYFLDKLSNKKR
ncbi:MAG: rRNA maturation RNase YbeY [Ignavibacteriales bacterium]|nr:rRNA maturation RNase YbeY [Ignavibacteriales bacterium]